MGTTLEERVGEKLRKTGGTVATAESCSGGLISHRITNVPGSSAYFKGGAVTYSNEAKVRILGVDERSLEEYGAVSEQVASEMADGARERFTTDYAVACTGVAGPTGGTEDKPVGLVYVAVATPGGTRVERCLFEGDRERIKEQTADRALTMLLESIE